MKIDDSDDYEATQFYVSVLAERRLHLAMTDWLKENVGVKGDQWDNISWPVSGGNNRYRCSFVFEDSNKALMFKLAFGGTDD